MTKEKSNDLFLLSLKGTKPIKKTNKITRPIPKQKKQNIKKSEKIKTTTIFKAEILSKPKKIAWWNRRCDR